MSISTEEANNIRTRIAAGEDVSPDEVRAALASLRQARTETAKKPKRSTKTPSTPVDIGNLLDF